MRGERSRSARGMPEPSEPHRRPIRSQVPRCRSPSASRFPLDEAQGVAVVTGRHATTMRLL
jgi:hypothetical protein